MRGILKKTAIIIVLFIIFTGLMLFRKGVLTKEKLPYLIRMMFITGKEKLSFPHPATKEEKKGIQSEEILRLLEQIKKEKEEVTRQKEKLKQWSERLLIQEKELIEKGKEILALKSEAENYIKRKQEEQTEEIRWLAGVYEKMKAEEAASIIEDLDENLSLAILSQMEERQAAKILAAMKSQQAEKLSQKIGNRKG